MREAKNKKIRIAEINDDVRILSDPLWQIFPAFIFGKVMELLYLHIAFASGLYTMTNNSDVQQEVLDDPEFEHFRIDLTISFQDAVEYLLHRY